MRPSHIILSPGPGRPENAGIITEAAATVCREIPTLGVCLGHQAICLAYGGRVTYAKRLMHGKQSVTRFDPSCALFNRIPEEAPVGRYHSLAAEEQTLPDCLKVTARTLEGEIMAKGYEECVVFITQDGVTVTVPAPSEGLSRAAVARITDVVLDGTEFVASQLRIVEVK